MNKRDRLEGLKRFINYVRVRCKLVENDLLIIDDNQYRYYKALQGEILRYGKSHRLFFTFLLGKTNVKRLMDLLGFSESHVNRLMRKQREELINLIYTKETELFAKYPFADWARWNFGGLQNE